MGRSVPASVQFPLADCQSKSDGAKAHGISLLPGRPLQFQSSAEFRMAARL